MIINNKTSTTGTSNRTMNNNVGPNGLDRQHGGLNHQDQGQGGHGGGGQGKSRYVPPHLRGRGGGDVPPRFSEERQFGGGGGGRGGGGYRGGDRGGNWDENRGAYRRDDRQGGGDRGNKGKNILHYYQKIFQTFTIYTRKL